jgi:hypothetical protein
MRRYNIISRILLILTVITFALAAPVLVQEKRQACGDKVHVPEDVITVLGKRTREQDLDMLWDGLRYYEHVWGNRNRAGVHLQEPRCYRMCHHRTQQECMCRKCMCHHRIQQIPTVSRWS